jgi:hypothetical protein
LRTELLSRECGDNGIKGYVYFEPGSLTDRAIPVVIFIKFGGLGLLLVSIMRLERRGGNCAGIAVPSRCLALAAVNQWFARMEIESGSLLFKLVMSAMVIVWESMRTGKTPLLEKQEICTNNTLMHQWIAEL